MARKKLHTIAICLLHTAAYILKPNPVARLNIACSATTRTYPFNLEVKQEMC